MIEDREDCITAGDVMHAVASLVAIGAFLTLVTFVSAWIILMGGAS